LSGSGRRAPGAGARARRRPATGELRVFGVLAVFLALLPAPAAAERCEGAPTGWGAGVEVAGVRHDVAGGVSGIEWGPDLVHAGGRVSARLGYRRVELDRRVTPHVVRGSVSMGLGSLLGARLCATLHGGGTRFSADGDSGTVLAGGAGLAVVGRTRVGETPVFPFLEVRGLGARSAGTVLDMSAEGTGLSLGLEAGARARLGRVGLRAAASLDGFAGGLGVTPYPGRSLRFGADYAL
jgi:hypothetical protein